MASKRELEDMKIIRTLRRKVNRVRKFPTHTCPASRHLHMMADALSMGKRAYPMLQDEPLHCAITLYAVLESLWRDRIEIGRLREKLRKVHPKGAS